jgi:hypothetical protein
VLLSIHYKLILKCDSSKIYIINLFKIYLLIFNLFHQFIHSFFFSVYYSIFFFRGFFTLIIRFIERPIIFILFILIHDFRLIFIFLFIFSSPLFHTSFLVKLIFNVFLFRILNLLILLRVGLTATSPLHHLR